MSQAGERERAARTAEHVRGRRIGIDVGGTNTDAVLVQDGDVVASVKTPTTEDVTRGVCEALRLLTRELRGEAGRVDAVMVGTTHFTNAVVQRRNLEPVAAIRVGLPSGRSLPPFVDWPSDLARLVRGRVFMIRGGHEYDGRPLVPFDADAVRAAAREIREVGIRSIAVSAVFSPLTSTCEDSVAEIVYAEVPDGSVTRSHELGRLGLLERENAALLNASLVQLARGTTRALVDAIQASRLSAPLYLTQNDGTVMHADHAQAFPVHCLSSGPTNSMRGAAFLSGLSDAMVVDVGGTTTDIGHLKSGFPREANRAVEVGGVRTSFRMPDILSIGLGGGSVVDAEAREIGPVSVGHRLTTESLVFGGELLTATDMGVAAGIVEIGEGSRAAEVDSEIVEWAVGRIHETLEESVDRVKADARPLPLLAVGGGAFLVPERMEGIGEVVRVPHAAVANAVGAAIAQVSGEVDRVFSGVSREAALRQAAELARERAVRAGARTETIEVVDVEDLPLAYLPGDARRVRVRAVGDAGAPQLGGG